MINNVFMNEEFVIYIYVLFMYTEIISLTSNSPAMHVVVSDH